MIARASAQTLLVSLVAAACLLASRPAVAQDGEFMRVAFSGELLDDRNSPISGVFPMTFQLFRSEGATDAVWEETQFVAVLEGIYDVYLGRSNGIPAEWNGEERVLIVSVGDLGAISTQNLPLTAWTPETDSPLPTIRSERLVDLAGRAIHADNALLARRCNTLSGQTVDQLDHFEELREQLDELRRRVDGPSGNRVGRDNVVLPRIGGAGGNRVERNCPPGFVMTGARGGAGNLIDGFRVICTQLE